VISLLGCPAVKLSVPDGSVPPLKSVALAGFAPLPVAVHLSLFAPVVSPPARHCKRKRLIAGVSFGLVSIFGGDRKGSDIIVILDRARGGGDGDRRMKPIKCVRTCSKKLTLHECGKLLKLYTY
jgi:hypothetical protein